MSLEYSKPVQSRGMWWTGVVLSALPILFMSLAMIYGFTHLAAVKQNMGKYGFPDAVVPWILVVEMICVVLYAIPQTATFGAVLLTGYLGGATATHVRAGEPQWFIPVLLGVIVWLGLVLRDASLRSVLPLRR